MGGGDDDEQHSSFEFMLLRVRNELFFGKSTVYNFQSKGQGNTLFFTTLSTFKFSSGNNYVACS